MSSRQNNTQMFALRRPPPAEVRIGRSTYRLLRVFKHDFWAATCLYARSGQAGTQTAPARIVVKFGRAQPFCGLPLGWYASRLRAHEEDIYRALAGVEGVPRWIGRVGAGGCAIEYIDARPLDHLDRPPAGFFDRLAALIERIHARGVAYCDANKRSNILVAEDGRAFLIDYQIALRKRPDWPWPAGALLGRLVDYLAGKDLYHLYKHKRRLAPDELRPEEEALSRRRGGVHWLHRKLTKPYRAVRRRFLREQYRKGALQSPTAGLEDHYQPEKQTWRQDDPPPAQGDAET